MKLFVTGVAGQLGHDVMNELNKRGYEGVGSDLAPEYSGIQDGTAVTTMPYVSVDITNASAVEKANRARNASFSAKMRCATLALRSIPHSATAAASGCTAETHDKSITAQFVHNAVDKLITNPTESKCFQWDFRVLRRKLCLKIPSISHAACRAKYRTL